VSDGFEDLSAQHREVDRLFERYEADPDDAIAREIRALLTLHAEIEEQVVYPELRRLVDEGDDLADQAEAEHSLVKTIMQRMHDSPPDDLEPLVQELRSAVTAHVRFEEERIFPDMLQCGVDADALARRVHAAAADAPSKSSGHVG
jgi:hemerythrin superfamily protein